MQFGFRRGGNTSQLIHIYRRAQEIHEEAGLELVTVLLDIEKVSPRATTRCAPTTRYSRKGGKSNRDYI